MKKKRIPKESSMRIIYTLLFILILIGIGLNIWIHNTTIKESPRLVFPPTPTFQTSDDERVITVSKKLVTTFDENLRIGGGSVIVSDYIDQEGEIQNGLTMYLYPIGADAILAYEGLEIDYQSYRIRVLAINEKGFSILAISQFP